MISDADLSADNNSDLRLS